MRLIQLIDSSIASHSAILHINSFMCTKSVRVYLFWVSHLISQLAHVPNTNPVNNLLNFTMSMVNSSPQPWVFLQPMIIHGRWAGVGA